MANTITPQQARSKRLKLDFWLIEKAIKDAPKAFGFKPKKYPRSTVRDFLKGQLDKQVTYSLWDQYYWTLTWEEWQEAIKVGLKWIADLQYKYHQYDCDNFAFLFSAFAALVLGTNTASTTRGWYTVPGKDKGGHLFNGIVARDSEDTFGLYWVEPQKDKAQWTKHPSAGKKTFKIGNSLYEPTWIQMF